MSLLKSIVYFAYLLYKFITSKYFLYPYILSKSYFSNPDYNISGDFIHSVPHNLKFYSFYKLSPKSTIIGLLLSSYKILSILIS